jgi:Phospholipase_D-nuclease N-terminal
MAAILILMGGITLGMILLTIGGWAAAILLTLGVISLVGFIFVFWIVMLVSAIKNQGLSDGEKIGWVLVIVFFHLIGSLLYLFIGYPKRNRPPVFAARAV